MKNFGKTTDIKDIITVGYEADNAVLYSTSQSLTNNQKAQARTNIGAGTSSFDGNYNSLSNKPTIPTKTSQLNNDSNFATTSQVEAKYTKPAGGIPKTDLATAVQNSLTAADNAVKYTSQSLTDAQKVQARANIGAGTSNFSGSYNDLTNKPSIPAAVSIVQSTGTSTSSVMSQKATTDAVNGKLSKTDNTNIEVLGTKKATTTLGGNQLYAPNGAIFGGTAAAAGLLTKGISGISVPNTGGACSKDNLYINYDGNNDFNAGRQIVLNAGTTGSHLGSNMYQYTVPRGDIVKNWVEAKGYATSVKVNGNTIASSGGVVDIGNVVTDVSGFMPKSGGTFTGNISVPKTITFTDETNPFIKMRTGGTDFYFQSTSGQFGLGPTWDKATHWDSNGNVTFPTVPKVGSSSLALKSDIPPKVTDSTVSSWGFTKNEGTVTSVSVKMNGALKGTVTSSGTIDLGTVLTDASKFATSAQGSNADSALAKANANATEISNIKNGTNGTKVKYAEHADAADSATSAGTADKIANGLTLGNGVVYDGSKALSISAGNKISINGGPGGVSIDLAYSVMPSTYNKVTVDGFGTVTAGENVDYLTSHQSIKSINTNNTTAQTANANEAIAGTGTINLHKVAKTGNYDDLLNKPTIPSIPTNYVTTDTDQDINGLKSFTQLQASDIKIGDSNRIYGASDSPVVDQFLPAKSGTFAMTSDIPTSYDDLVRIKKQAYTGGDNTVQYFKLASFPVYNSGENYASFIITGRMGGWQADNMSFVNMILYNRNGEGGGYINVANSAFFNLCDIVMYREADGTSTAYLKVKSYYTFDINVNTYQATNVYTGTDDTPTGTLKWTASEQADRLAVSGGVAYVNGFTLPKQVQINGATVNPNSAGLINLGTGFAKTADLPIKSASLSGTTLTITL